MAGAFYSLLSHKLLRSFTYRINVKVVFHKSYYFDRVHLLFSRFVQFLFRILSVFIPMPVGYFMLSFGSFALSLSQSCARSQQLWIENKQRLVDICAQSTHQSWSEMLNLYLLHWYTHILFKYLFYVNANIKNI